MKNKIEQFKRSPFYNAYVRFMLSFAAIALAVSVSFSIAIFNISSKELGRGLGKQARIYRDIQMDQLRPFNVPDFEQLRISQLDESSDRLRQNLIYFNLLILLLALIGGYFLAGRTIKPIEEVVESQNRFTADASHELRTPLAAMKSEIEVGLRQSDLKLNEARAILKSNLEEVSKLEFLSESLLKLARTDNQNYTDFDLVSLEEAVVDAYERVESLAEKKSIVFENNLKNVYIKGDVHSLVELFVILLDNAIKYSLPKSTVSIKIEESKNAVVVRIKDQGIGIKASDLPYIFNRFYRADSSRSKEKVAGYGLGLSIAKNIMDLHRGSISVASNPAKGSEFILKFPL
ncbi:MAG: HAMP domain-containing sensor histidine kinase [Patescibacteria group bacterium]|jgi:signal transduction histidine kinase